MALQGDRVGHLKEVFAAFGVTPDIAVETGTCEGLSTKAFAEACGFVYTIELSRHLHHEACKKFADDLRILCLWGDSGKIVPKLASVIDRPVFWYLDAHYPYGWDPDKLRHIDKDAPFPLFEELECIKARNMREIVVVDDIHAFGRKGTYWESVTTESIQDALKPVDQFKMWDSWAMLTEGC